jgi:hypothetical protein
VIAYLDQNHWIELARIIHGKDDSAYSKDLLRSIRGGAESGCLLPLSHIHYMETARISNVQRRARLGSVMWEFSKGQTLASYTTIVEHELELALSKHFPQVRPAPFNFLGRGIVHAFGKMAANVVPYEPNEVMERAMLTGNARRAVDPLHFKDGHKQREDFYSHLEELQRTKRELSRERWRNWLYAISLGDIVNPLNRVMSLHGLGKEAMQTLGEEKMKAIVDDMPTRRLDIHLHWQVLKNSSYQHKKTDLEDWAGIGVAACYCDVVVCEKHMASMLKRDGFQTKARIETSLSALFRGIGPT